jgi:hypothetical protein
MWLLYVRTTFMFYMDLRKKSGHFHVEKESERARKMRQNNRRTGTARVKGETLSLGWER